MKHMNEIVWNALHTYRIHLLYISFIPHPLFYLSNVIYNVTKYFCLHNGEWNLFMTDNIYLQKYLFTYSYCYHFLMIFFFNVFLI